MEHWPFWLSGAALAGVALLHWAITGRLMAVSGRFTALIERMRERAPSEPELTEEELIEAMREATRAAYGDEAVAEAAPAAEAPSLRSPPGTKNHLLFFGALIAGGLVSFLLAGPQAPTATLRSEHFAAVFGSGPLAWVALFAGGLLVGFGTRMAGGCTSGHGLCGVSRLQRGSLVATAAFFGTGIVVSLLLGWLS